MYLAVPFTTKRALVRVEVRLLGRRPRPEPLGEVEDVGPLEFLLAQVIFGGAGLRDTGRGAGVVDGAELRRFQARFLRGGVRLGTQLTIGFVS